MVEALEERFGEILLSQMVWTEAVGIKAPDYLNAVASIDTDMDSKALKQWCLEQERRLGRDRKNHLCKADLDILMVLSDHETADPSKTDELYYRPLIAEIGKSIR